MRPFSIRLVANAALAIGIVAAIGGVIHAVQAAVQTGAPVTVPATVDMADLPGGGGPAPQAAPGLPDGSLIVWPAGGQALYVPDSTAVERVLARGDTVVVSLGVLLGAFLLRGLLMSIADGRPFEPGNPRRLAGIAGLVVVCGILGPALPDVAGIVVLDRLGIGGPAGPYGVSVSWPVIPLLFAPPLLALAEAFRRGAELADDVRGLV